MPVFSGLDPAAVQRCAQRLAQGGLVAFATETVYGLGARADDDAAVAAIFSAKGRPADHPLIVHVAHADAALAFVDSLPDDARRLMAAFWPGPVTLVLPRRAGQAQAAAGGLATVGLRCPSHPTAQALLSAALALGVPGVAAPSANRFGRVSPTLARHVQAELGPDLWVLDGGACAEGIESTIIDCSGAQPALLRPGTTPPSALAAVLGQTLAGAGPRSPRVPGSLAAHYAPQAAVRLWSGPALHSALEALCGAGTDEDCGESPVANARALDAVGRSAPAGAAKHAVPTAFAASALQSAPTLVAAAESTERGPSAAPASSSAVRPSLGVYSRRAPMATAAASGPGAGPWIWRQMPDNATQAAHVLFADLRDFDADGVNQVWVEAPPDDPEWDGVRDRLQRAAAS